MGIPLTLTQFLLQHLADDPEQKEKILIMTDLAAIGKIISSKTNRAGLVGIIGAAGHINVQDEEVQKFDVFSNNLCKDYLRRTNHFASMTSEEEYTVVDMGEYGKDAKYVIAFDPLDGSSNIDVNVSIGTIFSVHRRLPEFDRLDEKQFFQKGKDQVIAGYILYGSSTVLVFSFGDGVHEFTLDISMGEFFLSHEQIKLPETCSYYSVNESNLLFLSDKDKKFVEYLKSDPKTRGRYIGSFVADFHRNLKKGGVFMYPSVDKDGNGDYQAKLRLNYEINPLSFLLETAGGKATDGQQNVLDIIPEALHQRVAIALGNKEKIDYYLSL